MIGDTTAMSKLRKGTGMVPVLMGDKGNGSYRSRLGPLIHVHDQAPEATYLALHTNPSGSLLYVP